MKVNVVVVSWPIVLCNNWLDMNIYRLHRHVATKNLALWIINHPGGRVEMMLRCGEIDPCELGLVRGG